MELECGYEQKRKPEVAILLSTYNGQKYIREQIDSILGQTYPGIRIYVRDDGSTDDTADILNVYAKDRKIVFFKGENIGYINSYFKLLKECGKADYYAWCDQDDIWVPKKMERAVDCLELDRRNYQDTIDGHKPVLYFSSYDFYDEEMHFQKHGLVHKRGPSFSNSLMDCITLGFNSVFNHNTRMYMEENIPEHSCGHDWWTYMICAAFGRVLYDREFSSVKYRRLAESVSPGGKNFLALQIWRFKKFFINDYFREIREQLYEFSKIYERQLNDENKRVMRLFSKKKYSVVWALRKTFYPIWFRQGLTEEIMVRILFLTGRL
ncbi:glycosyltransferase [bacterium 1XD42-54]|nr:glycosyltransferase [bacterium 1XD42-54]